jgi:hypothetical protein
VKRVFVNASIQQANEIATEERLASFSTAAAGLLPLAQICFDAQDRRQLNRFPKFPKVDVSCRE